MVEFAHLFHFFVHEGRIIVTYDFVRYPKLGNYVLLDEVCHSSVGGFVKWYSLHSLGEIFCGYKDPYIPIGRLIN